MKNNLFRYLLFVLLPFNGYTQSITEKSGQASQARKKVSVVNYKPVRLLAFIGKTDENVYQNFGLELNIERRLTSYLNVGAGLAYYRHEFDNGGGFGNEYPSIVNETNSFEPSLFLTGYLPVNALIGKDARKDRGFFPHISAGLFYRTASVTSYIIASVNSGTATSRSSDNKAGFYNVYGLDYKFSRGFGLSVVTQKFKSLWFGCNFQF